MTREQPRETQVEKLTSAYWRAHDAARSGEEPYGPEFRKAQAVVNACERNSTIQEQHEARTRPRP
jgi:hypothetical protein